MKNITIKKSIVLGFSIIILILMGIGLTNYFQLNALKSTLKSIIEQEQPTLVQSQALATTLGETTTAMGLYMVSYADADRQHIATHFTRVEQQLLELTSNPVIQQNQIAAEQLTQLKADFVRFGQIQTEIIALIQNPVNNFPARKMLIQEIVPINDIVLQNINDLIILAEPTSTQSTRVWLDVIQLRYFWTQVMNSVQTYLSSRDTAHLTQIDLFRNETLRGLTTLKHSITPETSEDHIELLEDIESSLHDALTLIDQTTQIHSSDAWRLDLQLVNEQITPLSVHMRNTLDEFVAYQLQQIKTAGQNLIKTTDQATQVILTLLISGILCALAVSLNSSRKVLNLIERLTCVKTLVQDYSEGKPLHDPSTRLLREQDEFKRLFEGLTDLFQDIKNRDVKIISYQNTLEERVEERTQKLAESHHRLESTIQHLELAKTTAESANKAKSQFLANMSHEIRTPMHGVMSMADLLQSTDMSEKQTRFVKTIVGSSKALLNIINDILDLSKIEAGRFELDHMPFNLKEMLSEALSLLSELAVAKSLVLNFHVNDNVPLSLIGDRNRLYQILLNLIGNAIKFTLEGHITLTISATQTPHAETVDMTFMVTDTGIGIAPEKQQAIFDKFTQADTTDTRNFGGTGLGLSISAHLVSLMGGTIELDSTLNKGSTFHFTVALSIAPEAERRVSAQPQNATHFSGTILVVDDNPVNQIVAEDMLQQLGCKIDLANNGQEAVEAYQRSQYDIILMDIQMPVMDGIEAMKTIQANPTEHQKQPPIIALTANALKEDRARFLALGFDGYLSKPFMLQELSNILSPYLTHQEAATSTNQAIAITHPGLDETQFLELKSRFTKNGSERFHKLILLYIDSSDKLLNQLADAMQANNYNAIEDAAHSLKSSSANLKAMALFEQCKQLEISAKANDMRALHAQFPPLEVEYHAVKQALSEHLTDDQTPHTARPAENPAQTPSVPEEERPCIWVVDDDETSLALAKDILEENGFTVELINNGKKLLQMCELKAECPSLLLLDVKMPGINGIDACQQVRNLPGGEKIPIIMATGLDDLDAIEKSYAAGATDFTTKPLQWSILIRRIRYILRASAIMEQLNYIAITDVLTQLPNRRHTFESLDKALMEVQRLDQTLTCCMLDIDFFKKVNDTYGHEAGDIVLREVSHTLQEVLRPYDFIGRIGGEEFFAFFRQTTSTDATEIAKRMLKAVSGLSITHQDTHISTSISIGMAQMNSLTETRQDLINRADEALYAAKNNGRNRLEISPSDE